MNSEAIEKIQNRPPAWCTLVISLLTFLLGWSVSVLPAAKAEPGRQHEETVTLNYQP